MNDDNIELMQKFYSIFY